MRHNLYVASGSEPTAAPSPPPPGQRKILGVPMIPGDTWLLISYAKHSLAHVATNTSACLDQTPPLQLVVSGDPMNNIKDTYSKWLQVTSLPPRSLYMARCAPRDRNIMHTLLFLEPKRQVPSSPHAVTETTGQWHCRPICDLIRTNTSKFTK